MSAARLAVVLMPLAMFLASCDDTPVPPSATQLAIGTWGGDTAAVIVSASATHVHIGCTLGDLSGFVPLDERGRFSTAGTYVLRAYPVQIGPTLPAQFSGRVVGRVLTLTIVVNDTVNNSTVTLGPVAMTLGATPQMKNCPICRVAPGESIATKNEPASRLFQSAQEPVDGDRTRRTAFPRYDLPNPVLHHM